MEKVFKRNVSLTMEEYSEIEKYLRNRSGDVNITKQVIIEDGENKFIFHISIENLYNNIFIRVHNKPHSMFRDTQILKSGDKINKVIGIMKCKYRLNVSEENANPYYFYFNIDIPYSSKSFPNKYTYYKNKQNMLMECLEENLDEQTCNEVIYAEFKNEEELALATYNMLLNSSFIINKEEIFHLYEEKLVYAGIELDECSIRWKLYTINDVKQLVSKMNKVEILNLMLAYVNFLKGNQLIFLLRIKEEVMKEIIDISYVLYDAYILNK